MKFQDWWVDPLTERDEWRYVWVVAGELFKQISLWKLLKLFAEANHLYWTSTAHHLVTVSFQLLYCYSSYFNYKVYTTLTSPLIDLIGHNSCRIYHTVPGMYSF